MLEIAHWSGFLLTVGGGGVALFTVVFALSHLENIARGAGVEIRQTMRDLERGLLVIVVMWVFGAALGAAPLIFTSA